jgi:ribonucleoside-diphosphate reductase alpha chain
MSIPTANRKGTTLSTLIPSIAARKRLPNKRASESISFECNGLHYTATISFFLTSELGEIFISNAKAGSHSDAAAKDCAVIASIALQFGVPLDTIRKALLGGSHGRASSPLGCALDLIAGSSSW